MVDEGGTAPAAGMGDADEVEVEVLRLPDTSRRGLQVTASPTKAIKMVFTNDETTPENGKNVAKYLFPLLAGLGRFAAVLHEVPYVQTIENCLVLNSFGLLEQFPTGRALDQTFKYAPSAKVVVSIGLAQFLVRDVGQG
jgi:hypothetical protein